MPTMRLKGKVIPRLLASVIDGLASGRARRTAAGAAMYDALAHRTPRIMAPPTSIPARVPPSTPAKPASSGKTMAKTTSPGPAWRSAESCRPVSMPSSRRKSVSTPVKRSPKNGSTRT